MEERLKQAACRRLAPPSHHTPTWGDTNGYTLSIKVYVDGPGQTGISVPIGPAQCADATSYPLLPAQHAGNWRRMPCRATLQANLCKSNATFSSSWPLKARYRSCRYRASSGVMIRKGLENPILVAPISIGSFRGNFRGPRKRTYPNDARSYRDLLLRFPIAELLTILCRTVGPA